MPELVDHYCPRALSLDMFAQTGDATARLVSLQLGHSSVVSRVRSPGTSGFTSHCLMLGVLVLDLALLQSVIASISQWASLSLRVGFELELELPVFRKTLTAQTR